MIQDVTQDAWEWHKFWYDPEGDPVDDNGEPYMPPVHCYSPLKSSTSVGGSEFFLSIVSQTEFSG